MSIYFIQNTLGHVKIGHSTDPVKRLSQLQVGCSDALSFMRIIDGGERVERWLHRRFAACAIQGEWFQFHDDMLTIVPPDEIIALRQLTVRRDIGLTLREQLRDAEWIGSDLGVSDKALLLMFVSSLPDHQAFEILELIRESVGLELRGASRKAAA